jgi:hypothetical protein
MKFMLVLLLIVLDVSLHAQDTTPKGPLRGQTIVFKQRERIKTKAKILEETLLKDIETKVYNDTDVDVDIDFLNGEDEYIKFVQNNLKANIPVELEAPSGRYEVEIEFTVLRDGTVKNVTSKTKFGYGMEREAVRVINKSGKLWKPAQIKGYNVNSKTTVFVVFQIND